MECLINTQSRLRFPNVLVALAAISTALPDARVSAFDLIPYMFYPFLLLVSVLVFIAISPRKNNG